MTEAPPQRSASWKWWICGLLLCASMINYMDRQTLANVAVRITDEFKLSEKQYGNLEWAFGWAFAAGSLVFGFVADRVSIRWLYPIVLLLWSLTGFTTGLVNSYTGLLTCRTLLGLFEAGHWPCALKTTQRLLAPADRTMGNGVLQSGASIGAVLTPLVMKVMLTREVGSWRLSFLVIGAVGVIWILFWLVMMQSVDLKPVPSATSQVSPDPSPGASFWKVVCSRRFLVLCIVVACINTSWQLLRAWLPKILQQGRGYSESDALYFNSLYFVATDIGCLGAGALTLWLNRLGAQSAPPGLFALRAFDDSDHGRGSSSERLAAARRTPCCWRRSARPVSLFLFVEPGTDHASPRQGHRLDRRGGMGACASP